MPHHSETGEVCQWDGAQPEGRRCTVKPTFLGTVKPTFLDLYGSIEHCESYDSVLGPAKSAADCEAVAPWCELGSDSHNCNANDDELPAAFLAVTAAVPPPPQSVQPVLKDHEATTMVEFLVVVVLMVGGAVAAKLCVTKSSQMGGEVIYATSESNNTPSEL